ncbi:MAG: hypothetical protein HYU69_12200 [Bacteroidetes bacterium]|nr:hypothetical protein [Bacteroidota bacterium]
MYEIKRKSIEAFHRLLKTCNKKLKSEPENMQVIRIRGILNNIVQLYDEAISDLNRTINHFPNDATIYYLRSHCYFSKGLYDLAKQDYLRALKIEFKKEESEFVEGYSEAIILQASISGGEEEIKNMQKILEYEKIAALLKYIPIL